jgi:S1-C subfamily serine protease
VGKATGSAFISSIQAKLVLSNMRVCGVCRPVSITERDGVHTVVVQW